MTFATKQSASSTLDFTPALGSLDRQQCEAILARNVVGRLAFALHDHVNITPVHFVYREGWIYGRTSPGGKLSEIARNRRVAFEVDEDEGFFSWRSVVVHGALYVINPDQNESEKRAYDLALALLRRALPTTLGDADPVPFRTELFRIQVSEISGRSSSLGGRRTEAVETSPSRATSSADTDKLIAVAVRGAISRVYPKLSGLHIDVFDEVVVLAGNVDTPEQRTAIERAVLGLDIVMAVVQQIETTAASRFHKSVTEIARDAVDALKAEPSLVDAGIKVVIEHDWLRAEGIAPTREIKEETLRRLRSVRGIRGVVDRIHGGEKD